MSLWVIVPAKEPWRAKSRLAGVLTPARRWSLSMQLLERTLLAVREATLVDRCLVISNAAPHLAMARAYGAVAVSELRTPRESNAALPVSDPAAEPLNAALRQAAEVAVRGGATALLVLHADLVEVSAPTIDDMVRAMPAGPGVVLAPDRRRVGTNALLTRPPQIIPFAFGPGSFEAHRRLAEALGITLVVHESPGLADDLDTPDDLTLPAAREMLVTGAACGPRPTSRPHGAAPHGRLASEARPRSTSMV
jgi:2-phospho-L-lactate/phosphoenolpyruvate guanylyltransferase